MREKEKWAMEAFEKLTREQNGIPTISFTQAWLQGFAFCKDKLLDLCDAKNEMVTFTEINRMGEKPLKEIKG